jgi:hypothetical protein
MAYFVIDKSALNFAEVQLNKNRYMRVSLTSVLPNYIGKCIIDFFEISVMQQMIIMRVGRTKRGLIVPCEKLAALAARGVVFIRIPGAENEL